MPAIRATWKPTVKLLAARGADVVFAPDTEVDVSPGHATYVDVGGPALGLEGDFRPGHFRGVATIVLKLFHLVVPDRAYFGRKDFQQSLVVRKMAADLNLPIEITVCPIVREADGLAMSSRNVYLSLAERSPRTVALAQSPVGTAVGGWRPARGVGHRGRYAKGTRRGRSRS